MGTNHVAISIHASPEKAPIYDDPEYKYATLERAEIVRKGTVQGNSTVDLVFKDQGGQKHVAMVTGNILKAIAQAVGEM